MAPAPPHTTPPCAARALFADADADADRSLNSTEAVSLVASVQRWLVSRRCLLYASGTTCFGQHVGGDELLSSHETEFAFLPCLLAGLSTACRTLICA